MASKVLVEVEVELTTTVAKVGNVLVTSTVFVVKSVEDRVVKLVV
jgi:hypothetical protein